MGKNTFRALRRLVDEDRHRSSRMPNVFDSDRALRYCSVCNTVFTSIKDYREHHYAGNCGGYRR